MLAAALFLLSLGLAASIVLAIASRVFYVWEDPKVLAVADELPGANCGGCGQAGCAAAAEAVAAGRAPVDLCVVGGFAVALEVGKIMGQKVEKREPEFSWTSCIYGVGEADPIYEYNGAMDCRAAVTLYGGSKLCPIGCIGLGTCVKACQFNALSMGDNNLPIVNHDNCVGCGACVKECPKNIITLTSATQRIMSEYTTDECTAPCQRTCPTGINIRGYIQEIGNGNYERALLTIKEKCPLPLICGYICPAPCEFECRRNHVDEGVAINALKRFVADYERTTHKHINPYKDADNGLKIAVIGGGAEGLTASYYLARLGYQPTIFEAKPELGGVLRYVIAEDRLPRDVLDHDIKGILEMGVEAKTNMLMGRDMTANSLLQEGYDAVVLTEGGLDSRKILHPELKSYDASFRGLHIMLDFLAALSQGVEMDLGGHVVISGSGLRGLELARKCVELGAQKVTIVSDQPLDSLPVEFRDTKGLRANGIEIRPSTRVAAIGGISDRLDRLALEDIHPRREELLRTIIDVDTLVISAGRLPELVFAHANGKPENPTDEIQWQTIETFRTFPKASGGDVFSSPEPGRISDSAAVVKSILSGRRLARAIHKYFDDELITPIKNLTCEADYVLDVTEVHDVSLAERQCPPVLDVEGDIKTAWIFPKELPGLDETSARLEAERCLQCGLICYRKSATIESEESEREDV
jgi:NADPH-dependent glutamate synthase beta subunit-like oxidoreductase/Na+-translocating ferredoxin:NAD+ oxidoreductase RNF subunit RnfB